MIPCIVDALSLSSPRLCAISYSFLDELYIDPLFSLSTYIT